MNFVFHFRIPLPHPYKKTTITSKFITGRSPGTQVTDQWIFAGQLPEWSDTEVPAVNVPGDLPIINRLVLGLSFLAAICTCPFCSCRTGPNFGHKLLYGWPHLWRSCPTSCGRRGPCRRVHTAPGSRLTGSRRSCTGITRTPEHRERKTLKLMLIDE